MSMTPSKCLLATLAFVVAASPTLAADRGKERLGKLFAEPVSKVAQSVVRIKADYQFAALGTVVSEDGLILTKGSELRGELTAMLPDGTAYDLEYVAYHRPTDLALLKIKGDRLGLKPVKFAEKSAVEVGHWVAAPNHRGEAVSVGVVSSGSRKLYLAEAMIVNENKGFLGIGLDDPNDGEGVLVTRLLPKSAAADAGLAENDVICEVSGRPISDRTKLVEMLDLYRPGDTVTLRVRRGGDELSFRVKLGKQTENGFDRTKMQNSMGNTLSGRRTGFPAVIQHDTFLRPSDCGGPLINLDGKVLGLNIARAGRVESWALPGDVVKNAIEEMESGDHPAPGQ